MFVVLEFLRKTKMSGLLMGVESLITEGDMIVEKIDTLSLLLNS